MSKPISNPYPPSLKGEGAVGEPAGYSLQNMMQEIYDADLQTGEGTSFWMDRMLGRPFRDPSVGTCGGMMSRGRTLFINYHDARHIGFAGEVSYIEESVDDFGCNTSFGKSAYNIMFSCGSPVEEKAAGIDYPSHWAGRYHCGRLSIAVKKFITENNSAVTLLDIKNESCEAEAFDMYVDSPLAVTGVEGELTGTYQDPFKNTRVYLRISADNMAAKDGMLTGRFTIGPKAEISVKVVMGFISKDIPESASEYLDYKECDSGRAFASHVRTYNQWWVDNIPYIDIEDPHLKKTVYYEWWKLRFNLLDANAGSNYIYPTFVEGCLGYNNAITLSVPWHIDDAKYFKNPVYAYGTWQSVAETSENGIFISNPGDPKHWPRWNIAQYISKAGWEAYKIHGGPRDFLERLAVYGENDVKTDMGISDTNNNYILERQYDGWDADTLSNTYAGAQDRLDSSAYTWANAKAVSEMYKMLGDNRGTERISGTADKIKDAVLKELWDDGTRQFLHRSMDGGFIPWRDINNYYPWMMEMIPVDKREYQQALKPWSDHEEFSPWPMYISNSADYRRALAAGKNLSRNYCFGNIGITLALFAKAIKRYQADYITKEDYKRLLYWTVWAHYAGGDSAYPDTNEFFSGWDEETDSIKYRSWIHHNALGKFNSTVIEDVFGLTPRTDAVIELDPIDIGLSRFAMNDTMYHGQSLSVVWDGTEEGKEYYRGVPKGFSLFVNGVRVATVDKLAHFTWDSGSGDVCVIQDNAEIKFKQACKIPATEEVKYCRGSALDFFIKVYNRATELNPPPVPDGLKASASSSTQMNIAWKPAIGALEYDLEINGEVIRAVESPYPHVHIQPGSTHKYRIRAANKAGSSEWSKEETVCALPDRGINLALSASAAASVENSSSWFSVTALNDGYDPASSMDYRHKAYSNWGGKGTQWVQYEWHAPVRIYRTDIYWFDDELSCTIPESYAIRYWDGAQWAGVLNPQGLGVLKDAYNTTAFDEVVTSKMRVEIIARPDYSTGIQEWKVFGEAYAE